jgi:hypothetical protein
MNLQLIVLSQSNLQREKGKILKGDKKVNSPLLMATIGLPPTPGKMTQQLGCTHQSL